MPKFRITACRSGAQPGLVEFVVQPILGELQIGNRFFCFDTHHPAEYYVSEIHATAEHTRLICSGRLGFEDQFAGATVDTSFTSRPGAFRYDSRDTTA